MKCIKILLLLVICSPVFGQNNTSLKNSTYILDDKQAKFIVFDSNNDSVLKGDFKNDNFKSKKYLFESGVIYYNKDSIGYYSDKKIYFENMKFKFRTPLFKNNLIENIVSKEKICEVEENDNFGVEISFKISIEKNSTLVVLTYWSNIMKINKILNKRNSDNDFILGFVTGAITNN
jgi:hypothetical protein